MPSEFRKKLQNAKGASDTVVTVFIDVRDFSSFSKNHDSAEVAIFVRHIYMKIIDVYFPAATFYKPTGDGLLVVISCDTSNVKDVVGTTIQTCQKIVDEFKDFCNDEPMVSFEVPTKVGIGVTRGTACRLESNGEMLDYSGTILNLAARLMDIARPSGVVLDSSVIAKLETEDLPESFGKYFVQARGYLRGVAETDPVTVYYDKRCTKIPDSFKSPIGSFWNEVQMKVRVSDIKALEKTDVAYRHVLEYAPADQSRIGVILYWSTDGNRDSYGHILKPEDFRLVSEGGQHFIFFDTKPLMKVCRDKRLKLKQTIKLEIKYLALP